MNYPNLYRGIVEDTNDPKNLGRCRVRVPSLHGALTFPVNILPWARPLVTTHTAKNRGSVILPRVKDVVWVLFEGGDKDYPIYIGGTYALNELPIDENQVIIYTEDDMMIKYDRSSKDLVLSIGDNTIHISPENMINVKSTKINLDGEVCINGVCPPTTEEVSRAVSSTKQEIEEEIDSLVNPVKLVRW